ncbi:right-handed parallel beta-helix repeat-containing protein, partial [bacterium]|nr:right-handed parallel beta-helix repeat-containing protein [bacterium]
WLKEKIGSHIIRRNNIHHCEQGGIIGRMGGVFSLIEDNHIHHINTMMELGGAEVAGIKMHAAIDVTIRRNHIHHCVMGIWTDWEAQGTRITQNLLRDNHRPTFAKHLEGGMGSQDIFVEVGHGPTLIDNNILLSDVSFRMATEGFALVHNLIRGPIASIDAGCDGMVEGKLRQRYTPYHIPHRTEIMGFMTILHGDDRIYNNIFIKKDDYKFKTETGTSVFDEFPTYEEWIANFDMDNETPDMDALEKFHFRYLPVWAKGNVYLNGAKPWKKEQDAIVDDKSKVFVELEEKDGKFKLKTNLYDLIKNHPVSLITTETLGKAFQPDQPFENPDGTPITFDTDFDGKKREGKILPGPFAGEF